MSIQIDKSILIKVAEGDQEAFKTLFNTYRSNIYTTALRITNNEWMAEDIVQDTFVKVWIKRHEILQISNFTTWLYVLSKNISLDIIKKKEKYKAYSEEEARDALMRIYPQTDYLIQEKDFKNLLEEAIERLPQKQKETYRLIREEYMKRDEAAKALQVSPETVKSNLDQAMKSIRAYCTANMKDIPFVLLLHFLLKHF